MNIVIQNQELEKIKNSRVRKDNCSIILFLLIVFCIFIWKVKLTQEKL